MGIRIPGFHLKSQYDLSSLRKRLAAARSRTHDASMNLTSLIDIFATILFYLILSFSATGQWFIVNKEIKHPNVTHGKEILRAPIITVFEDRIILEGSLAGANETKIEREEFSWDLPVLVQRLRGYREFFESVHTGVPYPGDVIIQADRDTKFLSLKKLIYVLVREGFGNLNFVAMGKPEDMPLRENMGL